MVRAVIDRFRLVDLSEIMSMTLASRLAVATAALGGAAILAPGARAENLSSAIIQAYRTNPTLQSARAQLRVIDETYVQARAGYRPQLNAQVQATRQDYQLQTANAGSANLVASQPIYTGGRTATAVSAAEADILSGREGLRETEASVLESVAQAYADVVRDQEGVAIRQQNLTALTNQLKEVQARTKVGDLTQTDIAQSRGYVNQAMIDLANAKAQLDVSRANYRAVVGAAPGQLDPLPPLPNLPVTIDQAFATAEAGNPSLRSSLYAEQAAHHRTIEARDQRRPTLSLQAQIGYTGPASASTPNYYDHEVQVTATLVQPLFAGGVINSRVRQQIERENTARFQTEQTHRQVIQQIGQSWAQYAAARENIGNAEASVASSQSAFEGVQKEARGGLRSTLEVLSIEQNLRDAELVQSGAKHDAFVLSTQLLQVMGLLEAKALAPDIDTYDPERSLRRVRNEGAVPWEAVPAILDNIGAPSLHHLPTPPTSLITPAAPLTSSLAAPTAPPSIAPVATASPPPAKVEIDAAPTAAPATMALQPPVAPVAAQRAVQTIPLDPTVSGGSHGAVVQFGAYGSSALAESQRKLLIMAYPSDLAGKSYRIGSVERNGKTLYRAAVAGFHSKAEAIAFCEKLRADSRDCWVRGE